MTEEIVIRGETSKARARRSATGWFDKYCPADANGIDVGCQNDPVHDSYRKWDYIYGNGDATLMEGVEDESLDVCYSSHCLEHLKDPVTAIRNWWRILKPGGTLCIGVPSADHYEGKREKPSIWNHAHEWFFLGNDGQGPHCLGFRHTIHVAIPEAEEVFFELDLDGWYPPAPGQHPPGSYTFWGVWKKPTKV